MKKKNKNYTTLGASNHVLADREVNDYYATDPKAMHLLLEQESFNKNVWEVASGEGHLVNVLKDYGHNVYSTDIINRGAQDDIIDFLSYQGEFDGDIITNPPFKHAKEFVLKSLEVIPEGNKVAMFLKLTFLEGKSRKDFFINTPFKTLYVSSSRIVCAKNGQFEEFKSSAIAYGWYVWEKGFQGTPQIKWIN